MGKDGSVHYELPTNLQNRVLLGK
jgi:hypothetical protein